MYLLGLREKDCKSPAFVTAEIKRASKNVDHKLFKEPIFYCLYGAGDILGKDSIPLPDCGNKSYHKVVYYFARDKDQCNKIFGHNLKFSFSKTVSEKAQFFRFRTKFVDGGDLLGSLEHPIPAGDLLLVNTICSVL